MTVPTAVSAVPTTAEPPAPATDEERINAAAAGRSWAVDESYPEASDFVQDICDTLDDDSTGGGEFSWSLPQWLAEVQAPTADGYAVLEYGVPLLCPQWGKTVRQAASGAYPVYLSEGTYQVTSKPGGEHAPPGTYRTSGDLSGCYWERTKADGTIIDNNFATAAIRITVTIRPGDDLFTSQNCGVWKPAR